jgi:prepilin peptidase CpaA
VHARLEVIVSVAFVALLVTAAVSDLRERRIPNWLTVGGVLTALALRAPDGGSALLAGALGAMLALIVSVPFFSLGALGGGDTKLLLAVGAFMGPERLVGALLAISLLGGAIAVLDASRRGMLRPVLANCFDVVRSWFGGGREVPRIGSAGALTIPYGVAIAAGALGWWFWGVSVV